MSYRYNNAFVKPGLNTLVSPTPIIDKYLPYLFSWGLNSNGQLGLGNTTQYYSPKQVGSLYNWKNISGGGNHILATKTDGTLWAWGYNGFGQLGQNNTNYNSSPIQIGALTTWSKVAAGANSSFAIKTDGTLWAWGSGQSGVLGLGNTTHYSSPKQVGSLTNWKEISSGNYQYFAVAIKTDGTLWAWGANNAGQLGLGNTTYYSSPKQIGALNTWKSVSCGGSYAAALQSDTTLWTWGENTAGQLGHSSIYSNVSTPTQVTSGPYYFSSVACGKINTAAISTSGNMWTWGFGGRGALGLGNTTGYSRPKQVGALTTWATVSANAYHVISTTSGKTIFAWGYNASGQLGLGDTTNRSSPTQIGLISTWLVATCTSDSTTAEQY